MTNPMTDQIKQKALGAYLGLACGDALGATVEFMSPKKIQRQYGVHKDMIGGGWLGLVPGYVTDDTQMSLALGQSMIDCQGWDIHNVAKQFVAWLDSFPPDVGDTCRRGILRYKLEGELSGPPNAREAGNGACMRILPVAIACLHRADLFETWTVEQNHITHHNHLSDQATLTLGNMVRHFLLGDDAKAALAIEALIQRHADFNYQPYPKKTSGYIVHTVQTVMHYLDHTDNFEDCLVQTVNMGGDADTTGAIVGMLAGAKYGVDTIPKRWLNALNPSIYGQIVAQTKALLQLADHLAQDVAKDGSIG